MAKFTIAGRQLRASASGAIAMLTAQIPRKAKSAIKKSLPDTVEVLFCSLQRIEGLFDWLGKGELADPVHVDRRDLGILGIPIAGCPARPDHVVAAEPAIQPRLGATDQLLVLLPRAALAGNQPDQALHLVGRSFQFGV